MKYYIETIDHRVYETIDIEYMIPGIPGKTWEKTSASYTPRRKLNYNPKSDILFSIKGSAYEHRFVLSNGRYIDCKKVINLWEEE